MNRRGIDLDDIEMLNVDTVDTNGQHSQQLSFFGEQSSFVSSDEISYTVREENATSTENIEKKETEKEEKAAIDYTLTEDNYNLQSGAKARFNDNIAAIKTLKNIEAEGKKATPAEQEILAKYVGWGGIPQAFDGTKNDWKKEYDELKKLLTNEEYNGVGYAV